MMLCSWLDCHGDKSPRNDDAVFGWMERDSFAACSLCRAADALCAAQGMTIKKGDEESPFCRLFSYMIEGITKGRDILDVDRLGGLCNYYLCHSY